MADTTSITREPAESGIATPDAPARRTGLRRTLARAAVMASCLACGLVALPAIASATVDNTASQWAELGPLAYTGGVTQQVSAVYSISSPADWSTLLEDHGNQMSNGAVTDMWGQLNQSTGQDPDLSSSHDPFAVESQIPQANYLWEFVPASNNSGGLLSTGYGELVNRQSGLCLDVNGSDPNEYGDGATVDQWACGGGPNQEWTVTGSQGAYVLSPDIDNGTGALGIGNSTCDAQGDGDRVYVRTAGVAGDECDWWNIVQQPYDFATHQISVSEGRDEYDGRSYGCIANDWLRWNTDQPSVENSLGTLEYDMAWDYDNVSGGSVTVSAVQSPITPVGASADPNELFGGNVTYNNPNPGSQDGQILLYCDPTYTGA
jgi:Ricin-type beta-trefoil lectin domain-like